MRTNANTKRELAVTAHVIDLAAAQIESELDHECMPEKEAAALSTYARGIRNVAESLFLKSQPKPTPRPER